MQMRVCAWTEEQREARQKNTTYGTLIHTVTVVLFESGQRSTQRLSPHLDPNGMSVKNDQASLLFSIHLKQRVAALYSI